VQGELGDEKKRTKIFLSTSRKSHNGRPSQNLSRERPKIGEMSAYRKNIKGAVERGRKGNLCTPKEELFKNQNGRPPEDVGGSIKKSNQDGGRTKGVRTVHQAAAERKVAYEIS